MGRKFCRFVGLTSASTIRTEMLRTTSLKALPPTTLAKKPGRMFLRKLYQPRDRYRALNSIARMRQATTRTKGMRSDSTESLCTLFFLANNTFEKKNSRGFSLLLLPSSDTRLPTMRIWNIMTGPSILPVPLVLLSTAEQCHRS